MSQSESRALLPDWHQRPILWEVDDEVSRVEYLSASTTDKGGTPQPQLDLSFTQSGSDDDAPDRVDRLKALGNGIVTNRGCGVSSGRVGRKERV